MTVGTVNQTGFSMTVIERSENYPRTNISSTFNSNEHAQSWPKVCLTQIPLGESLQRSVMATVYNKGVVEIKSRTGEGGRGPDLKRDTELPYIAL